MEAQPAARSRHCSKDTVETEGAGGAGEKDVRGVLRPEPTPWGSMGSR